MSEFAPLQNDECKDLKTEALQADPVEPPVCPDCIPDPSSPKIDWLLQDDPYFDPRTCEYIVKFLVQNLSPLNPLNLLPLRQLVESKKASATATLLRYFNKLENDETTSLGFIPEDGIIVDDDNIIKAKLVINAVDFNRIPNAPNVQDSQSPENPTSLPDSMTIDDSAFDFYLKFPTVLVALEGYDVNYQFFQNNQKAIIRYELEDTFIKFDISQLKRELKEFKDQLYKFVELNDYVFVSLGSYFIPLKDRIQTLRIEFDNSDPEKPLSINKVFIAASNCPEVEIKKGLDVFKKKAYMPTALFFMSNFQSVYEDINLEQPREWIDFFTEYIYPPIKVDYGEESEEIGMTNCPIDTANFFKNLLQDLTISFADMFEFEMNKNSCSDVLEEREPALQKILETQSEKRKREFLEKKYLENLKKLKQKDVNYQKLQLDRAIRDGETPQQYEDRQKKRQEKLKALNQQIEAEAKRKANESLKEYVKNNPDLQKHPYYEMFEYAIKEKTTSDDSILSIWKGIQIDIPADSNPAQDLLNAVGLCGFTRGVKRAINCILKQISWEEAIASAVKTVWNSLTPVQIEEILLGLPPAKQIEIRTKVEEVLGRITPPWESEQTQPPQDISQDVNKNVKLILDTYVEMYLATINLDVIINAFKQYPPMDFLLKAVGSFIKCPSAVLKDISNMKLKNVKVDICNPVAPIIPKIPKIQRIDPFKFIGSAFKFSIDAAIRTIISTLVTKMMKYLENSLCEALGVYGKMSTVVNPLDYPDAFASALKEAICPDASDDDLANTANDLLNKIGAKDSDISSAFDCLSGALMGTMSLKDMRNLILDPRGNPQLAKRVQNAIEVGCPRFSDLFNNPVRVENFFNNMRNLIPPEGRDRLAALGDENLDNPIYETICLTSEELNRWNDLRRQNLENLGLSSEDAANQVELYNNRATEALSDLMSNLNPDPSQAFQDAMNDLMNQKELPPGCDLKEGESLYGSKALSEPKDVVLIQEDISNKMFDIIGDNFKREFTNNPNPFAASLISKILSDTRGNSYELHTFFERFFATTAQYHDSELQQQRKEEVLGIFADFGIGEERGYFPQTVGEDSRIQLSEDVEYSINQGFIPQVITERPNYSIFYQYGGIVRYPGVNYISDILSEPVEDGFKFNYKILTDQSYQVIKQLPSELSSYFEQHVQDTAVNFKNSAFNYMLNKSLEQISNKPSFDKREVYRKSAEKILNGTKKLMTEGNNGFIFGFEDEDLTEDQLTYVGPDGEEPYYDFFEEEDKVLGRAKEETNRVFFLDPEQYGGTYREPPVYIAPKEMNGWMKIAKIIAPDEEICDPKSENILGLSEIKKKVNNTMNSAKFDNRSTKSVNKCFVEKPFDKILSKNAMAGIDGVLDVHIRMKIAEELTKSFSILSMLEWSDANYDSSFIDKVMESLIKDLKEINPLGFYTIKQVNYYLLFLEQIVEQYRRDVVDKLPEISPGERDLSSLPNEIRVAYQAILNITESFNITNIEPPSEGRTVQVPEDDPSLINDPSYFVYCLAYQKYGDDMFSREEELTYTPISTIFLSKHKRNMLAVIFAIRLVEDECKIILREIVKQTFDKIITKFYKEYNPQVKSLKNYLLTSKDIFMNNNIQSFGEYSYEQKISIGSFQSMGQAEDVVDVEIQSPWGDTESDDVSFKIERYVRIYEKENLEVSEELQELLNSRDHNLRGVVKIEDLQSFFTDNIELFEEYNITDIFGSAELDPENNSFVGDIGLSYGMRIVMKLDSSIISVEPTLEDLELSRHEKCHYCDILNLTTLTDLNYSIPICSAEVEIKDQKIKDLNLLTGEESYDSDCLARKLTKSNEFSALFDYIIPINVASSMSLLYINRYFLTSIGREDGWDEDVKIRDLSIGVDFQDTKNLCRKFFASFYNSTRFTNEENLKAPRLEFPNFFKLIFGGLQLPQIQIGQLFPPDKEFNHRIVTENPFNKNREECDNDVDKLI